MLNKLIIALAVFLCALSTLLWVQTKRLEAAQGKIVSLEDQIIVSALFADELIERIEALKGVIADNNETCARQLSNYEKTLKITIKGAKSGTPPPRRREEVTATNCGSVVTNETTDVVDYINDVFGVRGEDGFAYPR